MKQYQVQIKAHRTEDAKASWIPIEPLYDDQVAANACMVSKAALGHPVRIVNARTRKVIQKSRGML